MVPSSGKVTSTENDFATTQIIVFFVIILLAIDTINPIKIILHVFPWVAPWHIATLSLLLLLYVFITEMKQLLYKAVKIFFNSILSIFFRDVQIVGAQNIPLYGPVIFTSNHANQFIDSVVLLSTCQRNLSYLIAEKSWNRRIIGDLAWALGAVPVKRAQDSAFSGEGVVTFQKRTDSDNDTSRKEDKNDDNENLCWNVIGTNTKFTTQLATGDKIRLPQTSFGFKIVSIQSDSQMIIDLTGCTDEQLLTKIRSAAATDTSSKPTTYTYDILKKMDQKEVYEMVLSKLASGGTIGIFPEGGSHDRTDLLPLKVGVALISFLALERDGVNVPIVPVGLNYFRGHRFRGSVTVEFGRPTFADPNALEDFKRGGIDKRRVCTEFLERIEDHMRGVIVSAPDYESLQIIQTARRLYRKKFNSPEKKQDLSRRFAEGYKQLHLMSKGRALPKEWVDMERRMVNYQKELNELGIRDYQVPGLCNEQNGCETTADFALREMRLPYRIAELILLFLVSFIPAVLLNLPVGLIARVYANRRRKKALAASKVKVKGLDVMLSEKVMLCIVLVPSLWITYGLVLYFCTDFDGPTIALIIGSLPLFSYMGIVIAEAGMVELKDLKPHLIRLFPSTKRRLMKLPDIRLELQQDLREFIKDIGPSLGDVYTTQDLDWAQFQQETRIKLSEKDE